MPSDGSDPALGSCLRQGAGEVVARDEAADAQEDLVRVRVRERERVRDRVRVRVPMLRRTWLGLG